MAKQKRSDDDVIATAKERYARAVEAYAIERAKAAEDIKFVAASPDNPEFQWDSRDLAARKGRPALTVNKMPQHVRQVTNDIRQNRPAIKVRPADSGADVKAAEVYAGVIRNIEAQSRADVAYDTAAEYAVMAGEGYIRVLTDYATEDSFDQEIRIKPVHRPFQVWLDPDREDPCGIDAAWAFVEERIKEADFKAQYPKADAVEWDFANDDWCDRGQKTIRVAEYFEVVTEPVTLLRWHSGATSYEGDPLPAGVMLGERPKDSRKTHRRKVIWRKINGQQVLEEREFPSRYIGIVRVVGNEFLVDGKPVTSGIVRNAKDAQRLYNLSQSAIAERTLQAPRAPWAVAAESIEGYENVWKTANTGNHAFLPYNALDSEGNALPPPQRISPAAVEMGLLEVSRGAADDIKGATAQYDASLGQRSNETSGKAIMARQREGDTATFHYIDNLRRAVEHVGRILVDMIPRVYTEPQVVRIMGEDGEIQAARLDPTQPQPMIEGRDGTGAIFRSLNPTMGRYDVYSTAGPSYTTKRVEAADAMTEMVSRSPQLWGVIGDLLVKNMDWPGADQMSKRLKATLIRPVQQVVGEDEKPAEIPPQVQQAMQQMGAQLEQSQQAIERAVGMIEEAEAKAKQAEAKAMEETIRADRAEALLDVEKARGDLLATMPMEREQPETPEAPEAPAAPSVIVVDSSQKVAELIGQLTNPLAAAVSEATQTVSAMAAQTQAALAEASRPRAATVVVQRQPDGSYVGQRVEGSA